MSKGVQLSSAGKRRFRVGIDIGGTFTDCVIVDRATGEIKTVKVPTVPSDPSVGFLNALDSALGRHAVELSELEFIAHGTTVATNTIIEGKGAKVGLITSEGFSDVLEIAYQTRTNLYDLFYKKPPPLVPRHRAIGVPERIGPDGRTIVSLDGDAVRAAARKLKNAGAQVIVVAFLHAYKFPQNEIKARDLIKSACPDIPVVISSDICPEHREYPRTSTAVVNAVLLPIVGEYISRLEERLQHRGAAVGLHLMTSAGGVIAAEIAGRQPVQLVESGPAATVIGANYVAECAGFRDIIVFDMGGTTAKVAPVTGGVPRIAEQFEVGPMAVASDSARRGLGYPVRTPVVEMVEVSAGGGSVASLDPGGALTVGPESMGADPGPACYGRGGDRPTITDANLVLGRLNPDYFLGGEKKLDIALSRAVIQRDIAGPLKMSVIDAAHAIVEIGTAKMAAAMRLATIRRGIDPRRYALVAAGGGGPLHAAAIARQVGISRVVIPPSPGLTSALGLLATDLKHDFAASVMQPIATVEPAKLVDAISALTAKAKMVLREEEVADDRMHFSAFANVRYVGQSFHLTLGLPEGIDPAGLQDLHKRFNDLHRETYGFANDVEPTMIVNVSLTALGSVDRPIIATLPDGGENADQALKGVRQVYFPDAGGQIDCAIYERSKLRAGNLIAGPAILEQMDTTTLVPPGATARAERSGVVIIDV
jgi:N-methylhydantoinase A